MGRIFGLVSGIIAEGVDQGAFAPMHPALAYFSLLGPLVMFRVSAPIRERMTKLGIARLPDVDRDLLVNHLQMTAQRMLARSSDVGGSL
jgi:hypothetical protein